jgi:hypothetical protein
MFNQYKDFIEQYPWSITFYFDCAMEDVVKSEIATGNEKLCTVFVNDYCIYVISADGKDIHFRMTDTSNCVEFTYDISLTHKMLFHHTFIHATKKICQITPLDCEELGWI